MEDSLCTIVYFLKEEAQDYGIDWSGPAPSDSDNNVTVPGTPGFLTGTDMAELQSTILDQSPSTEYGIDT